jgi:hypothetical protein
MIWPPSRVCKGRHVAGHFKLLVVVGLIYCAGGLVFEVKTFPYAACVKGFYLGLSFQ